MNVNDAPLPYATLFNRCRARRDYPGHADIYNGRCDLQRNHVGFDHCLERGLDMVFWSDVETSHTQTMGVAP